MFNLKIFVDSKCVHLFKTIKYFNWKYSANRYRLSVFNSNTLNISRNISMSSGPTMKNDSSEKLSALRTLMQTPPNNQGSIQAYIIPSDDAHQSEWLSQHDERRAFISNFDGSAGTCVVTLNDALLWTDGRYYLQANQQLDSNWTLMKDGFPSTPEIGQWINKNLPPGSRVGTDPLLMSYQAWHTLETQLESYSNKLIPIENNLIDAIWMDQPPLKHTKIFNLGIEYTGRTTGDKLIEIRKEMIDKEAEVMIVTALDEIAYLLNMRGCDIDYNPLFFAYVIITIDNFYLFIHENKLVDYQQHFERNGVVVTIRKYEDVKLALSELLGKYKNRVWISKGSSYALTALIPNERRLQQITPINLMKAVKNDVEALGMIKSHIRDGVALCQYFAWLENQVKTDQHVDEISGADKLEEFRSKREKFVGISFPTINGSGPNGSVIHYHSTPETNRRITNKEIYLCDSGAQYLDGTTDVTRTMHFGSPTPYEIECYTRVLIGQITLGKTIFPKKVKGKVLDTLARKALWDVGLDYRHGTGHGIGSYLCVHEGPMGVGIREMPDDPGLSENMFISNEPGYYEEGKFGIRIEDIVQIVPAVEARHDFAGRGALTFSTITMCPIQTKMVDVKLLSDKERKQLNSYNQRVLDTILPILETEGDEVTAAWLKRETVAV